MSHVLFKDVKDLLVVPAAKSTRVQQHFKEEVDVNTIVRRFGATGQLPNFMPRGMYGDFTGVEDYDSAVALIDRADRAFLALPANVRERFHNDPGELMRAASISDEDEFGKILFPVTASGDAVVPPKAVPAPPVPPV